MIQLALRFVRPDRSLQSISRWALTLVALMCAGIAPAADIAWTNPAGGSFQDPANWQGGVVPGTADLTHFDLAPTYTVGFQSDTSIFGTYVTDGDVTWDLGTHAVTVEEGFSDYSIQIARQPGDVARLMQKGGIITSKRLNPGRLGGHGELWLTDAAQFQTTFCNLGRDGDGSLRVELGSRFTCAGLIVGDYEQPGAGDLVVSGLGTRVDASNMFAPRGSVLVESGGQLVTSSFS